MKILGMFNVVTCNQENLAAHELRSNLRTKDTLGMHGPVVLCSEVVPISEVHFILIMHVILQYHFKRLRIR